MFIRWRKIGCASHLAGAFTLAAVTIAGAGALSAQESGAKENIAIVFDGSGSMATRMGRAARIDIARDAVKAALAIWQRRGVNLGLIAYGHRSKDYCGDIQTLIPAAPVSVRRFSRALDSLRALGKTPITEAVRRAADELNFRDRKATIILISDGKENCGRDLCAAARELKDRGLAFTAHVIGFGMRAADEDQLQCLATETGGRFFRAGSARELDRVLRRVARGDVERGVRRRRVTRRPVTPRRVVRRRGARIKAAELIVPSLEPGLYQLIIRVDPNATPYAVATGRLPKATLRIGEPRRRPRLILPPDTTDLPKTPKLSVVRPPVRVLAPSNVASLTVPRSVEANALFTVTWRGPNVAGDKIQFARVGGSSVAGTIQSIDLHAYGREKRGRVTFRAPTEVGRYELRYFQAGTGRLLARRTIEVKAKPVLRRKAPPPPRVPTSDEGTGDEGAGDDGAGGVGAGGVGADDDIVPPDSADRPAPPPSAVEPIEGDERGWRSGALERGANDPPRRPIRTALTELTAKGASDAPFLDSGHANLTLGPRPLRNRHLQDLFPQDLQSRAKLSIAKLAGAASRPPVKSFAGKGGALRLTSGTVDLAGPLTGVYGLPDVESVAPEPGERLHRPIIRGAPEPVETPATRRAMSGIMGFASGLTAVWRLSEMGGPLASIFGLPTDWFSVSSPMPSGLARSEPKTTARARKPIDPLGDILGVPHRRFGRAGRAGGRKPGPGPIASAGDPLRTIYGVPRLKGSGPSAPRMATRFRPLPGSGSAGPVSGGKVSGGKASEGTRTEGTGSASAGSGPLAGVYGIPNDPYGRRARPAEKAIERSGGEASGRGKSSPPASSGVGRIGSARVRGPLAGAGGATAIHRRPRLALLDLAPGRPDAPGPKRFIPQPGDGLIPPRTAKPFGAGPGTSRPGPVAGVAGGPVVLKGVGPWASAADGSFHGSAKSARMPGRLAFAHPDSVPARALRTEIGEMPLHGVLSDLPPGARATPGAASRPVGTEDFGLALAPASGVRKIAWAALPVSLDARSVAPSWFVPPSRTAEPARRLRFVEREKSAPNPPVHFRRLEAVRAGYEFEVFYGPAGNTADLITIARPDMDDDSYLVMSSVRKDGATKIRAPGVPGAYELRYISRLSRRVVARQLVTVEPSQVRLVSRRFIEPGEKVRVWWGGPGALTDYILITEFGRLSGEGRARKAVRAGNPVKLRAPRQPGRYEVQYVSGATGQVLGRRKLVVIKRVGALTLP